MSYNGRIGFGLLADYDSMEDVEAIAEGITELAGRARAGGRRRAPDRLTPPEPGTERRRD